MKKIIMNIFILGLLIGAMIVPASEMMTARNNKDYLSTESEHRSTVTHTMEMAINTQRYQTTDNLILALDPSHSGAITLEDDAYHIYEGLHWQLYITAYWDPPQEKMICLWIDESTMPAGSIFDPCNCDISQVTSTFSWTPSLGQAGTYAITFYVGESCYESIGYFTITVVVHPYETEPSETYEIFVDQDWHLELTAYWSPSQPERQICLWPMKDTLPYNAVFTPECNCDYGQVTSDLYWTPTEEQVGDYLITVFIGDNCGYYQYPSTFQVNVRPRAQRVWFGTLCTHNGSSITQYELRNLLDRYIPTSNANSTLIVLTECYGGDTMRSLTGRQNTTVLSATSVCQHAYYGGYDEDATRALRPGRRRHAGTVHDAGTNGRNPNETPQRHGDNISLEPTNEDGPIKSRHVLVYSGQPHESDQRPYDTWQRDTIRNNFAGQHNTTVTSVGGNGTDGWDFPGTENGLRDALDEIQDNMSDEEQFILYVTDHGDKHYYLRCEIIPETETYLSISVNQVTIDDMISCETNVPDVSIFSPGPTPLTFDYICVNGQIFTEYTESTFDINKNGIIDGEEGREYIFPIDEELLKTENNEIEIFCTNGYASDARVSIGSGDISKPLYGSFPYLYIKDVTGGFGISAVIGNSGTSEATEIKWTIQANGNIFIGGESSGTTTIPVNGEVAITSGFLFGFGPIELIITVDTIQETKTGSILLFYIFGV